MAVMGWWANINCLICIAFLLSFACEIWPAQCHFWTLFLRSYSSCNSLNFWWNSSKKKKKKYFNHMYLISAKLLCLILSFEKSDFWLSGLKYSVEGMSYLIGLMKNFETEWTPHKTCILCVKVLWSHRIFITLVIYIDSSPWLLCSPSVKNINTEQPALFALLTQQRNFKKMIYMSCGGVYPVWFVFISPIKC